jgi:hypothetical protein
VPDLQSGAFTNSAIQEYNYVEGLWLGLILILGHASERETIGKLADVFPGPPLVGSCAPA